MITVANQTTTRKLPYANGYGFKTSLIFSQHNPLAVSLRRLKSVEKQRILPGFEIEFSEFDFRFKLEIIEIDNDSSSNEVILHLKFNRNVIKAVLSGYWKENEGFYLQGLGLVIDHQGETPTSGFLLKTLWAMFGLSSQFIIKIPDFKYEFTTSFDVSLDGISDGLRNRQIAYRLMVIEKALAIKLPYPNGFIDGEDVQSIAFCYHAIIERNFEWFLNPGFIPWTASKEYFSLLGDENEPFQLNYPPEFIPKNLFGFELPLGYLSGQIDNAVLDNYEEAKEKLSKLDGSEVLVYLRSLNGMIRYNSVNVPTLPKNAFSKDIQKLIDLDSKFDSIILDRYFALAASTLDGLSEEQKAAITERPKLKKEPFVF